MPTYFRPCIDLHDGVVKQIIGSSLDQVEWTNGEKTDGVSSTISNFISSRPPSYFASKFKENGLRGGHVIMLGQGIKNIEAAKDALLTYPRGLHIGGGIRYENAENWLEAGAEKVILTSALFDGDLNLSEERLRRINELIGRQQFVVDLSCRPLSNLTSSPNSFPNSSYGCHFNGGYSFDEHSNCSSQVGQSQSKSQIKSNDSSGVLVIGQSDEDVDGWVICLNGWTTKSNCLLTHSTLEIVSEYASEVLIHAVANEGLCSGIDSRLIRFLGQRNQKNNCRVVYAGGVNSLECLYEVERISNGTVDVTIGSALDIYGGDLIKYSDCVEWNTKRTPLKN